MRTYLYKLTSDRGGAPCAPPPTAGADPLLTLSICKPAIRRTAQIGDRILGVTSRALVAREGYPECAVIYAAHVTDILELGAYYAPENGFTQRPDCVYEFHAENGMLVHAGRTKLHAEPAYAARDVGSAPHFRNARTLVSKHYRYFGADAVPIPAQFSLVRQIAESLGQGHRVFDSSSPEKKELDKLFHQLWKESTKHTPTCII